MGLVTEEDHIQECPEEVRPEEVRLEQPNLGRALAFS